MKKLKSELITKAIWLLFYLYIILLSYFLFFSERYGRDYLLEEYRYNLVFFKEIRRFIKYREQLGVESFVVNILGNIFAFAPFGFLLPLLNQKYRKFIYVALLSILFSITIETLQMFSKVGIFDVDDLILNSFGGMFGYISFVIGNRILKRVQKRTR